MHYLNKPANDFNFFTQSRKRKERKKSYLNTNYKL